MEQPVRQSLREIEACLHFSWLKRHLTVISSKQKKATSLFDVLCIKKLKLCCQPGRYGKDCKACPGSSKTPCNNNGVCSGEGTRGGHGTFIATALALNGRADLCYLIVM